MCVTWLPFEGQLSWTAPPRFVRRGWIWWKAKRVRFSKSLEESDKRRSARTGGARLSARRRNLRRLPVELEELAMRARSAWTTARTSSRLARRLPFTFSRAQGALLATVLTAAAAMQEKLLPRQASTTSCRRGAWQQQQSYIVSAGARRKDAGGRLLLTEWGNLLIWR